MSKNNEMVALFMSESFRTHKSDLDQYVAADFVFKSSRYGELNFADYVKYAAKYYHEEILNIEWIHSDDDENFGVAYKVTYETGTQQFGVLAVSVFDNLVTCVVESN